MQAKLHGSANTKVLSVSEKQPPPEEVWTQKVQTSGTILFLHYSVFRESTAYVAVINSATFGRGSVFPVVGSSVRLLVSRISHKVSG